ncbi:MAG TPA: glycosyltransferase family 2 protein [Jatrophihabitantaceae bacterium]
MRSLSFVIPALNENENIAPLMGLMPLHALRRSGWDVEVLVVDNGSSDGTAALARNLGARVIVQPARGYGNAYKLGFANASGDVIITGDADLTYPFDAAPELLTHFRRERFDFLNTNRLSRANWNAMKPSHVLGNRALTSASRSLFRVPFRDSQSGMWIFRRRIWEDLDVRSPGMAFSQEIKHEAAIRGFQCGEIDIEYRPRGGEVKLNAARDGFRNLVQLGVHRARAQRLAARAVLDLGGDFDELRDEPLAVAAE